MGDIDKAKLVLTQCFVCSGWTPPHLMRDVVMDTVEVKVCVSCHKKLRKRAEALELEAKKQEEELSEENEIASSFGNARADEEN